MKFNPLFILPALIVILINLSSAHAAEVAAPQHPALGYSLSLYDFPQAALASIDTAAYSGAASVRIPLDWNILQPARGEFAWEPFDALVDKANEHGLEVVFVLGPTAHWASKAPQSEPVEWRILKLPQDWNDWRAYVSAAVAHFRGRVRYWQIWEGFDFPNFRATNSRIAPLAQHAFEAAKEADPTCRLILPEPGGIDLAWIERLQQKETWGHFDILGLRPSDRSSQSLALKLAVLRSEVLSDNGKPLWVTGRMRRFNPKADGAGEGFDDFYSTCISAGVERVFNHSNIPVELPVEPLALTITDRQSALALQPPLESQANVEMDLNGTPGVLVENGLYNSHYSDWPGGRLNTCRVGDRNALRTSMCARVSLPQDRDADNPWFYFDVDDRFLFFTQGQVPVAVTVECAGASEPQKVGFNIYYDAGPRYRFTPWQWVDVGPGQWFSYRIVLPDGWFANKAGYDFRINSKGSKKELSISRVVVEPILETPPLPDGSDTSLPAPESAESPDR